MQRINIRATTAFAQRFAVALLLCSAVMAAVSISYAQSNRVRRQQQPPPSGSSTTGATGRESTPSSPQTQTPASLTRHALYVATYVRSTTVSTRSGIPFRTFIERLQNSAHLSVVRGGEMSRGQARTRARSQSAEYVVWLQLDSEVTGPVSDDLDPGNPDPWFVDYIVFTPRTGEIAAQGRVYQRRMGDTGGVLGRNPRVSVTRGRVWRRTVPDFYALERMGTEAAERVIAAFNSLPVQP